MGRYACVPGVATEPVGHLWAVFSPASGETLLLNDESASILEVLASGACDTAEVCAALAISEDNLFVRLHRARRQLAA